MAWQDNTALFRFMSIIQIRYFSMGFKGLSTYHGTVVSVRQLFFVSTEAYVTFYLSGHFG